MKTRHDAFEETLERLNQVREFFEEIDKRMDEGIVPSDEEMRAMRKIQNMFSEEPTNGTGLTSPDTR